MITAARQLQEYIVNTRTQTHDFALYGKGLPILGRPALVKRA